MMDKDQIGHDADALKHSISFIRTIIQYEETIQVLYSTYSEIFTDNQAFWYKLAQEEAKHAQAAKGLMTSLIHEDFRLDPSRHDESHFLELLTEASRLISNAVGVDELSATSAAISLESTTLQRKLFETVENDANEIKKVFGTFRTEHEDHTTRLSRHAAGLADTIKY